MARIQDQPSKAVLIQRMDGDGAAMMPCPTCGDPLLFVAISRGIRAKDAGLSEEYTLCTNRAWKLILPCPRAMQAKSVLDRVMAAGGIA